MMKTAALLVAMCLAPLSVWAGDYTVYSWLSGAKVAVNAGDCKSFAQARQTADVLSALHSIEAGSPMDSQFSMISNVNDPLTTWVVQTAEPFQPHEYFWVGDKDKKDQNQTSN